MDWRDYEVPDWVVDDYNSRVSEKDRIPLGKYARGRAYNDCSLNKDRTPSSSYVKTKSDKIKVEPNKQINEDDINEAKGVMITLLIFLLIFTVVVFCI